MPLQELTSEPVFMTAEEHARLQEATPSSFQGHAPVLRLKLDGIYCYIQPKEALPLFGETSQNGAAAVENGNSENHSIILEGTLWISEDQVSFLTASLKGFSLDYPSLSLHAISRSLPSPLQSNSSSSSLTSLGCLYCQLEGVDDEEEEEEEQSIFPELWFLPAEQDSLEPLFEALSYCASLHPSITEEEDEGGGGGHPFSGVGPFGTGLVGGDNDEELASEGEFDDADEEQVDNAHLSETGRATLAKLDLLLEDDTLIPIVMASSSSASFHSGDSRKAPGFAQVATNSLILVHLPDEIFTQPPLAASLLDLLHAYGDLASWSPLPSFGRALIVYEELEGAQRAKDALDRLVIPLMEEGSTEEFNCDSSGPIKQSTNGQGHAGDLALRAYFGPMTTVRTVQDKEVDHLAVPTTDRNFLISPPGSPPVGWEPIKEDPPNRDTLADDLIRALGSLRDKGLGVHSHQPKALERDSDISVQSISSAGTLSAPSIFIPPREAIVRSCHPLAKRASSDKKGIISHNTISLPGVMVQSVDDDDDDDQDDQLDERLNKGLSISSVKATVESMNGAFVDSFTPTAKITPTSRPPLS